jgi:hypothetical protein
MKYTILTILTLTLVFASEAQTFQRLTNESAETFIKRIYKVEELSHPIIETKEWDTSKKVIICFIEFESNEGGGVLGYLLTPTINQIYKQTLIDTFFQGGGASSRKIETVFFANADKDKPREIIVMTKAMAHSPRYADNDLQGYFYESYIYDNYNLQEPPNSLTQFKKLSEEFQEFEGIANDSKTSRFLRKEKAKYKDSKAIRLKLKQLGY